jgi:hypothetical protein
MNKDLETKLRKLGEVAGTNLFVNIAKLDDPNYVKIVNKFNVKTLPTIIMTAIDKLAFSPAEYSTAYVKIDDKRLLDSPELTFECIQKMFNLFIVGKISEAVREKNHDARISRFKGVINDALKGIQGYLMKWDISFSFMGGKLEVKPRKDE